MTASRASNSKPQKTTVILSAACILLLGLLGALLIQHGYANKLLVRLGFIETKVDSDRVLTSWESSLEMLGYDADVVFYGDSITRYGHWNEYYPDAKICNLGISGDTLADMIKRTGMIASTTPEKVFVMGGINGMDSTSVDMQIEQYEELIGSIRQVSPDSTIYIQSVLPIGVEKEKKYVSNERIRQFNIRLKTLCEEEKIQFIDIYSLYEEDGHLPECLTQDGLHLIPEAYSRWADAIRPYIQ